MPNQITVFDVFEAALVTALTLLACWVAVEHHALGGAAAVSCLLGCRAVFVAAEQNLPATLEEDRRQLPQHQERT